MNFEKWYKGNVSGEKFLEKLYVLSAADGTVYIPNWNTDRDEKASDYPDLRFELSWSADDCRTIIERFTRLKNSLRAIAEGYRENDEDLTKTRQCLTAEQLAVMDTYLTAWNTGEYDPLQLDDLIERSYYHNRLTARQQKLLDTYYAELEADAKSRVGDSPAAYQLVNRAKRLWKLYEMAAPDCCAKEEERFLAAAMAVHAFGKSAG